MTAATLQPDAARNLLNLIGTQAIAQVIRPWLRKRQGMSVRVAGLAEKSAAKSVQFLVANHFDNVRASWQLVYDVYRKTELIDDNPFGIHATAQSISPNAAIFCGVNHTQIESTLTAIVDDDQSTPDLPLDSVYKNELDRLRSQGRRLVEYGMFAHQGQITWEDSWGKVPGTFDQNEPQKSRLIKESLYELMRLAFYFGLTQNSTDSVIGVHPRHARFYRRAFGYKQIGKESCYPTVKNQPVVLLHISLEETLKLPRTPYVLDYCLKHPVSSDLFDNRFQFNRDLSANPRQIIKYLAYKNHLQASRDLFDCKTSAA